jgi:hypothetical protein
MDIMGHSISLTGNPESGVNAEPASFPMGPSLISIIPAAKIRAGGEYDYGLGLG